MFTKRLRLLLNYQTRVTCSKFHSNNHRSRANLNFPYNQLKNNACLKNNLLPIYTVRSYSEMPAQIDSELDNNDSPAHNESEEDVLTENTYMYQIVQRSSMSNRMNELPIIPEKNIPEHVIKEILAKNYEDYSVAEIIEDFKMLSYHARLNSVKPSEKLHGKLFTLLEKYVPDMMDEDLWDLLRYVAFWFPFRKVNDPESFMTLRSAIDNSLCERMNGFTVDEMLMTCDLLMHLRQPRQSNFIHKALMKLGYKPKKMSPANYIHYMYIINITRKSPANMYELEYALESIVDTFDSDQLGVVAAGFFKTKTPIRDIMMLKKIINKCTADMDSIKNISLCAVMKVLRLSMMMQKDVSDLMKMMKAFESRVDREQAPCLIHAGHLAAALPLPAERTVNKISESFKKLIPTTRVKDLERMLYVLVVYNHPRDSPIYELIIEEMRKPTRADEYLEYFRSWSTSLMYLSYAGIYPLDVISKAMDHDYLEKVYGNNAFRIGQHYFNLEISLNIEVPTYSGPTLPPKIRSYLMKRSTAYALRNQNPEVHDQYHQKTLFDVSNHVKKVLGTDKLIIDQLLPHHERVDMIYCLNTTNNTVAEEFMANPLTGPIKYAPTVPAGHKWIAAVIASFSHVFRGTKTTSGILNAKTRLLEKIGYTPVVILTPVWRDLKTSEMKNKYLQMLFAQLNERITHDLKT